MAFWHWWSEMPWTPQEEHKDSCELRAGVIVGLRRPVGSPEDARGEENPRLELLSCDFTPSFEFLTTVMGFGTLLWPVLLGDVPPLTNGDLSLSWWRPSFCNCCSWYCSNSYCIRIVLALEHSKASSSFSSSEPDPVRRWLMSLRMLNPARDILVLCSRTPLAAPTVISFFVSCGVTSVVGLKKRPARQASSRKGLGSYDRHIWH